jgi:hypothetical protein
MQKMVYSILIVLFSVLMLSCASLIVDGESIRTSKSIHDPKSKDVDIEIYLSGKNPDRPVSEIGRVSARAWVLEKGINELKVQARELGADAVTNIRYERKFSVDYLQDLYFLDGEAIVWK